MAKRLKVVLSGIYYPLAMLRYFERALERRSDVELIGVGPYTGSFIPWQSGLHLASKYAKSPTCPLPQSMIGRVRFDVAKAQYEEQLKDVDLWLQVDAGWHFLNRPKARIVAHVQTDPHCIKQTYKLPKSYSDFNFCMQSPYMEEGELYLPYAYDPTVHYYEDAKKEYDVCLIGLQYRQRNEVMQRLKSMGVKVFYEIGHIFDEYREINCKSKVGFNWSSLLDLNARAWELAAMGICSVQNTVPDMRTFFVPGEHYLEFNTADEAVNQIVLALSDDDLREEIGNNAYRKVTGGKHTWDDRVESILHTCGLI